MYDDEFDDFSLEEKVTAQDPPKEDIIEEPKNEEDLTSEILKIRGIQDTSKIKFESEEGQIEERSWSDLSKEEKLNILIGEQTSNEEEDNDLDDSEIDLINTIRNSGLSVQDYLQSLQPIQQTQYPQEEFSDDEMYAYDLISKIPDITDDEITEAIDNAKKNETLYKKTVEGLRKEYSRLQEEENLRISSEIEQRESEKFNNFSKQIMSQIGELKSFAGQELELSDQDVDELSQFMLQLDENGTSAFGRALNDPELFVKAAFWILNEDKIIEQLNEKIKDSYTRGANSTKLQNQMAKVVVKKPQDNKNTDELLDIDDEDWLS